MFWHVRITQGKTETTFVFPWDGVLGASDALDFALSRLKNNAYDAACVWRE